MKPLHDINAAAKMLSISPWTVRLYIRQGRLRPVRIGRRVLLEESELERLIGESKANQKVENPKSIQEEGIRATT